MYGNKSHSSFSLTFCNVETFNTLNIYNVITFERANFIKAHA
ncbi:Uncharacterised protein [Klebsiella pneumoniae]|nr:Uncharacterised protein [Klebsiella pneumoniae]